MISVTEEEIESLGPAPAEFTVIAVTTSASR